MDHWSIKDLKTFCEQHGIDHRDCVEKPELVKVASAHAEGLFAAHKSSGAKSRDSGASSIDSGANSASATGATATGASAATTGGGSSSSEATAKARVNLERLAVGARLYEKYTEASRALGLDDVGTSDAVRVPPHRLCTSSLVPPHHHIDIGPLPLAPAPPRRPGPDPPALPCAAAAALSLLLARCPVAPGSQPGVQEAGTQVPPR